MSSETEDMIFDVVHDVKLNLKQSCHKNIEFHEVK
jgi:hypothetical protein